MITVQKCVFNEQKIEFEQLFRPEDFKDIFGAFLINQNSGKT
jgi:hypothetical protein